ncbi:hypothetical protein B0T25DRAFT_27675 [Lasiosphaeria hispida]|uniref:RRM domain-containing protein n=1 Tax=Lasiosphaeria hispida TaxID=260671 RepID=A0AAJ0HUX0_9PEZI|nr:hypothetical protein B0T25DRAFT_27675 [Lasiosphaeria hispida]
MHVFPAEWMENSGSTKGLNSELCLISHGWVDPSSWAVLDHAKFLAPGENLGPRRILFKKITINARESLLSTSIHPHNPTHIPISSLPHATIKMNCLRRSAFRSALAASKQVAPKTASTPFSVQIAARANIAKPILIQAARCFSQSTRVQNIEDKAQDEFTAVDESAPQESVQESQKRQPPHEDATPHACFVRNLIFDATEEHLKTAFEKYGEVVQTHIVRDPRGLSKGYGFVYFATSAQMQAACSNVNGSFWHGRRVTCIPRMPKEKVRPSPESPTSTLYVGNIPYETTDAELNAIFRDLDNITDIRIAVDRTTGWPRGFAHADFADVESARIAHEKLTGVQIGERQLIVDFSEGYKKNSRAGPPGRQ